MAYTITELKENEIKPGTFVHSGNVYRIDEDGNLYQWDQNAHLGGFFKKIGKLAKKVGKAVKKAAPYVAAGVATYYGGGAIATALLKKKAAQPKVQSEPVVISPISDTAAQIIPAASAAVSAYYNSKAAALQQPQPMYDAQGYQIAPPVPQYTQGAQGIPDVTPTLEKYKTPIMIGIGVIGLALAVRR